jgi:hypothetical protein
MKLIALAATLALTLSGPAAAQRQTLGPGDGAPGIDIESWVIGEPVSIENGKVYVILFSPGDSGVGQTSGDLVRAATVLGDALEENAHRGLVVLLVSPESAERAAAVARGFEKVKGFTIGTDRRNATHRGWVQSAQIAELPVAFVVDRKGRIAHIGLPREEDFIKILGLVLRNRYDARLVDEAQPDIDAARRARKRRNWRMAMMHYDKVIALDSGVFADIALERFQMLISNQDMDDPEAGYAYARDQLLGKLFASDGLALRDLASKIALDTKIDDDVRDLDLALEAAEKAVAISGRDDPESLATLALVNYHLGNIEEAVRLQTRAYFIARPKAKPAYKRVLKSYQDAMGRAGSARGP